MSEPTTSARAPWLLIIGMVLGGGMLVVMTWDSIAKKDGPPGGANVVEFTAANWQTEVIDSDVPVLVDFTAKWCGPCQSFAPIVSSLADRYQGKIKVGKFDVGNQSLDKAQKLSPDLRRRLSAVPYVMIFKGGQVRAEFEGGRSESELARVLEGMLQ